MSRATPLSTQRVKSWLLAACLGGALALLCAVSVTAWLAPPRPAELTRQQLLAALEKWRTEQPANYDMTVKVSGRQPGVYQVVVDNQVVSDARLDGRQLTNQRTLGTWSVPGMFQTIRLDVETRGQSTRSPLILRAEFDERYGFPAKYERVEMRTGAHQALSWEVVEFATR